MKMLIVLLCVVGLITTAAKAENLLTDGGFELGTGWSVNPMNGGTAERVNHDQLEGDWCMHLTSSGGTSETHLYRTIGVISGGGEFTFEFYAKSAAPAVTNYRIDWFGATGLIGETGIIGVGGSLTGTYQSFVKTFTVPATATHGRIFFWQLGNGEVYIDNVWLGIGEPPIPPAEPTAACCPVPDDNQEVSPSLTTLSWTNPAPKNPADTITAAAYLLESSVQLGDPNLVPGAPGVVELTVNGPDYESADITGLLSLDKFYYWTVTVTDPNTPEIPATTAGPIWAFHVSTDVPPAVNAGADQPYLWLDGGHATFTLAGTSDGNSFLWTGPAGTTINNSTSLTATATVYGAGDYVFTLRATNSIGSSSDTVGVHVYPDFCDAAYADPADINAKYPNGQHGDLDGDCDTDIEDFAILAAAWLECMTEKAGCLLSDL